METKTQQVYICDAHGVSIGKNCCVNGEDTGWIETSKTEGPEKDSKESEDTNQD